MYRKFIVGFVASLLVLLAILVPVMLGAATISSPGEQSCSGTITLGGTAQVLIAAGPRTAFQIQNLSTDALAFSEQQSAPAVLTSGSWTLAAGTASAPGGSYNSPTNFTLGNGVIWIVGATTSDAFTCAWK